MNEEHPKLTFDELNTANMMLLSDGSLWRVAPPGAPMVGGWRRGDPIIIKKNGGATVYGNIASNLRTKEGAPVTSNGVSESP